MTKSRNKQAGHSAQDTARNKVRFLKELADGYQPNLAAVRCGLAHSTVFAWKAEDAEFAEKWHVAHEVGLDKLERDVYMSGRRGNPSNGQFILKARRNDVFGQHDERASTTNNFLLNITTQEHTQRLARLGLRSPPMIEGDYEEEDAPSPTAGDGDPPA
jgi:hypothetical protein